MNSKKSSIALFNEKQVRRHWDEDNELWYFSIIDVITILTDINYQDARNYWKVLKHRLKQERNETVTNCNQLKMLASDGKMRMTDVADTEQLLHQKLSRLNYGLLKWDTKESKKPRIRNWPLIERCNIISRRDILKSG